jgi:uncharacterized protein YcgI (DUF1989 family)
MSIPAPDTDAVVPAGEPWMGVVRAGQLLRIVDMEGNQAVDTLFYNAADPQEHYSAQDTIRAQGNIYLTTGTTLLSNRGNPMLRIVDDTCGRVAPVPPRATRCAIRWTSGTCTVVATASCWPWRARMWA